MGYKRPSLIVVEQYGELEGSSFPKLAFEVLMMSLNKLCAPKEAQLISKRRSSLWRMIWPLSQVKPTYVCGFSWLMRKLQAYSNTHFIIQCNIIACYFSHPVLTVELWYTLKVSINKDIPIIFISAWKATTKKYFFHYNPLLSIVSFGGGSSRKE